MTSSLVKSTRILPGLSAEHAIISLPNWAWDWLDDLVEENFTGNYAQFVAHARNLVKKDTDLPSFLSLVASDLRDFHLRQIYKVSNDNDLLSTDGVLKNDHKPLSKNNKGYKFPTVYMIFKFLPHATTLQTIWTRRNYSKMMAHTYYEEV